MILAFIIIVVLIFILLWYFLWSKPQVDTNLQAPQHIQVQYVPSGYGSGYGVGYGVGYDSGMGASGPGQWIMSWQPPTQQGNIGPFTYDYVLSVFGQNGGLTGGTVLTQGNTSSTSVVLPQNIFANVPSGTLITAAVRTHVSSGVQQFVSGYNIANFVFDRAPQQTSGTLTAPNPSGLVLLNAIADSNLSTYDGSAQLNFLNANPPHAPVQGSNCNASGNSLNCQFLWRDGYLPSYGSTYQATYNLVNAYGSTPSSSQLAVPPVLPGAPNQLAVTFQQ